jgi:hypothetical protein
MKLHLHHAVPLAAMAGALLLSACVTINIYFPAAAAEKAADKIIDEVWHLQKPGEAANQPGEKPEGRPEAKEKQQ